MSYWNYRVVKKDNEYGIYEVFYEDDGSIYAVTRGPIDIVSDDEEELRKAMAVCINKETLIYSEIGNSKSKHCANESVLETDNKNEK